MMSRLPVLALVLASASATLPGCTTYDQNQCVGDTITTNASFAANQWFTPPRGAAGYVESFQDYAEIAGYATVTYHDTTRTSATVTVRAQSKGDANVTFVFNGKPQAAASADFSSSDTTPLKISLVSGASKVDLEPIDFAWNIPALSAPPSGDYRNGQKGAIVELFGWPDKDVEQECAFIGQAGYLGVKLYPHQEQLMSGEPFQNLLNPWYFMYQPVSYKLQGRMGTREQLKSLIAACRKHGVRVYADAVINHMTGGGNDMTSHRRQDGSTCTTWGNKSSSLASAWGGDETGPSPFYTQSNVYGTSPQTKLPPSQEFPAAGYGPLDFHCERVLNSWNDPLDLNAGWLTGLTDLNTERPNVQERIAAYLTDLLSIGMSGFRIDAAKHIKPDDLVAILGKLKQNMGGGLPEDFVTWMEVLLGGEGDMLMCNADSGYNYGGYLLDALGKAGFSTDEANMIKIWNSGYPKETEKGLVGCDSNAPKVRSVIQNDDADQQNPGSSSRDMGDDGCVLIKGCDPAEHRGFETKLFQQPNGASDNKNDFPIRVVLSSFYWQGDGDGLQGIPDGKSDCALCSTNCDGCQSVGYAAAFNDSSVGYDAVYTRVHRDPQIVKAMRDWMELS